MITKISKVLTIFVTVLSLAFLGATAVSSIARTDWKAKANEFPRNKTQELQTQIDALNKQRDEYAALTPQTIAGIAADQKAMITKAEALNQYAVSLETQDKTIREQNATTAVQAQEKLDTDKVRREEVQRLQAQYEELVSQRAAAQAEVDRLRDLLYQSRGVLQRAVRRNQSLKESLGQIAESPYDPAEDEASLPPARFPDRLPAPQVPVKIPADPSADEPAAEDEEVMEEAPPAAEEAGESTEETPTEEAAPEADEDAPVEESAETDPASEDSTEQ